MTPRPLGGVFVLQPPSPPFMDVDREFSAGLGLASDVSRPHWGQTESPFYSHELAWTAGTLMRAGYRVRFADGQAEGWDAGDVVRATCETGPSAVVMLVNMPSLKSDLWLLERIKESVPGAVTLAVGTVNLLMAGRVARGRGVDFAVQGEPMSVVPRLLDALREDADPAEVPGVAFESDGQVIDTGQAPFEEDLDSLAFTPYRLMRMEKYVSKYFAPGRRVAQIVSTKGCPFKCGYYCPYPATYGTKVRYRTPELVAEEMQVLRAYHGVEHFIFRDQNFTIDGEHAERVCRAILDRGLDVSWVCETRLTLVDNAELLRLMRAAGCAQINFGLETGDPAIFESVGKPGCEYDRIIEAVEATRSAGIRAHGHAVVGLPGESWSSVRNTARLLKRCSFDSVNFSRIVPVPGTRFYEDAKARGWVLSNELSRYGHTRTVVRTERMSGPELKLATVLLSNRFEGLQIHRNLARRIARTFKKMSHGREVALSPDAALRAGIGRR